MARAPATLLFAFACACRPAAAPSDAPSDDPFAAAQPPGQPVELGTPAAPPHGGSASHRLRGSASVAERLEWMVGHWVADGEGRLESETWVVEGDDLRGTNETRVVDRLVHHESLLVTRRDNAVVYEARPSSQPPHVFALTLESPRRVRFEDPAHDWPQSIEYVREGDTLTAIVSGTTGGEDRRAVWTWRLAAQGSLQ